MGRLPSSQSYDCVTAPSVSSSIILPALRPMCAPTRFTATKALDFGTAARSPASARRSTVARPAVGFPNGRLEVRGNGVSIPCSVFDKDQRVTHAAITENKHLSAVPKHNKRFTRNRVSQSDAESNAGDTQKALSMRWRGP